MQSKFPNPKALKNLYISFCNNIMVGTETKKGVSPVIASVLMVMIAIGLIAFTYTWFTGMARQAKASGAKHMGEMEKSLQELKIVKVVYNSTGNHLCFKIRAPLTNTKTVPLGKYITYIIDTSDYKKGDTDLDNKKCEGIFNTTKIFNCTSIGGLEPGDECWGGINYTEYPSFFEIKHDWGIHEVAVPEYK